MKPSRFSLFTLHFSFFTLILLFLLSSCTSKKKLVSPMAHAADYEWMNAKITGEINVASDDTSLTSPLSPLAFTGSLRMRRDSTVWLSVSALMGMEGIRALITQDSVFVINRMNQTYFAEPFSAVAQTAHVSSLQEVQAMLLGDGTSEHVAMRFGLYTAKIHYSDIQWNTPIEFPLKINKKYERIKL